MRILLDLAEIVVLDHGLYRENADKLDAQDALYLRYIKDEGWNYNFDLVRELNCHFIEVIMAEFNAYCWRKRLLVETSGPDKEMAWIDELAHDIDEDPQLLKNLIFVATKLKGIDQYLHIIENLSWYAAIRNRINLDMFASSVYSVLLGIDMTCAKSPSYSAQIASALRSKSQLIEALEMKPIQSA